MTRSINPTWKDDFPIARHEEHKASRREFAKLMGLGALACAGFAAGRQFLPIPEIKEAMEVATVSEIPVGGYKLFDFPTKDYPCVLIHLEKGRYVAYSQSCTHLMCPVHYNAQDKQLVCPCHSGYFNAEDGSVLAGPPPRPLPSYPVTVQNGKLFVGPMSSPAIG